MKSQLKCATDQIHDFENVNCTNCECPFMLSDDLICAYICGSEKTFAYAHKPHKPHISYRKGVSNICALLLRNNLSLEVS